MKTPLLLLSLFLLNFKSGYSQTPVYYPFPEKDAVWNMYFSPPGLCPGPVWSKDYYSMILSGDTVIGNQTYHKLNIHGVQVISTSTFTTCGNTVPRYKGAIRQDIPNKKVFIVPPSANSEQLLYDFNMQVGDVLKGHLASASTETVQAIDNVLVGNNYRKRWKINDKLYLIEGIGSTWGLVERSWANATDWPTYMLTCFQQNGTTLYLNTSLASDCNLITSVNPKEKNSVPLKISPNPFSTQAILSSDKLLNNATLTVYNAFGQEVTQLTHISGQTIVLTREHLASGLYFIRLAQGDVTLAADKLVITD